jgi:hypothetical protein
VGHGVSDSLVELLGRGYDEAFEVFGLDHSAVEAPLIEGLIKSGGDGRLSSLWGSALPESGKSA